MRSEQVSLQPSAEGQINRLKPLKPDVWTRWSRPAGAWRFLLASCQSKPMDNPARAAISQRTIFPAQV